MMYTSDHSIPNNECDYTHCRCCPKRACICRCAGHADDDYYDRYFRYTYQYVDPRMFRLPYIFSPFDINPKLPDDFGYPDPRDIAVEPNEEYVKKWSFDTGVY